nr:hypothetical protein [Tanacetum cinerariifolium]
DDEDDDDQDDNNDDNDDQDDDNADDEDDDGQDDDNEQTESNNDEGRDNEMTDASLANVYPNSDIGIYSILVLNTELISLVDVPVTTNLEMPPSFITTLPPPPIPLF